MNINPRIGRKDLFSKLPYDIRLQIVSNLPISDVRSLHSASPLFLVATQYFVQGISIQLYPHQRYGLVRQSGSHASLRINENNADRIFSSYLLRRGSSDHRTSKSESGTQSITRSSSGTGSSVNLEGAVNNSRKSSGSVRIASTRLVSQLNNPAVNTTDSGNGSIISYAIATVWKVGIERDVKFLSSTSGTSYIESQQIHLGFSVSYRCYPV